MSKEYITKSEAIEAACNAVELFPSEYQEIENAINRVVADVAPVVYGEWIEYACSAYGGIDEYGDVKRIPKKKFLHKECGRWNAIREPFCPNCGAKMGGKQ